MASRITTAGILACLSLVIFSNAMAFGTLDGDKTRWNATPTFSMGQFSPDLPVADQQAAIRALEEARAQGSSRVVREEDMD